MQDITKVGIVGLGQIGRAINEIVEDADYVPLLNDPIRGLKKDLSECDVVHVCVPGDQVIKVVNQFGKGPFYIIHSTVEIGTTTTLIKDGYRAVHAPIRGRHPDLTESIRKFVLPVGGMGLSAGLLNLQSYFSKLGIIPYYDEKPESTELAKLLCTLRLGLDVVFIKHAKELCDKYGVDLDFVYTSWTEDYNEGYEAMGEYYLARSILEYQEGPCGGHCVIENAIILKEQHPESWIAQMVLSLGKDPKSISGERHHNKAWLYSEHWGKHKNLKQIAEEVGCTPENISALMKRRGVPVRNNYWTYTDDQLLTELSDTKTFKEIAQIMDRSYDAIRSRAIKLGIRSVYDPGQETQKPETRVKISSTLQGITPEEWDGFKESLNSLVRKSEEYQDWRKKVFERDNFKCVKCGINGYVEADHIKPFALYPELRFDITNGQTLCKGCHKTKTSEDRKKYEQNNLY